MAAVAGVAAAAFTVTMPAEIWKLPAPAEMLPSLRLNVPPFTKNVLLVAMLIVPELAKLDALLIVPAFTFIVPELDPLTLIDVMPVPVFFVKVPALLNATAQQAGTITSFPVAVITPVAPLLNMPEFPS